MVERKHLHDPKQCGKLTAELAQAQVKDPGLVIVNPALVRFNLHIVFFFWNLFKKGCMVFNDWSLSLILKIVLAKSKVLAHKLLTLVHCEWGPFEPVTGCSKSCGGGFQQFIRYKTVSERNGGSCPGSNLKQEPCNTQNCPGEFRTMFYKYCCIA